MYEDGMFSSIQAFCDASDQIAFNNESSHMTRAVSSNVGHDYNSAVRSCASPLHRRNRFNGSETVETFVSASFLRCGLSRCRTPRVPQS